MANTRNNPLEGLAIHLPMVCDRYELRDDVKAFYGPSGSGIEEAQAVGRAGCGGEEHLTKNLLCHDTKSSCSK